MFYASGSVKSRRLLFKRGAKEIEGRSSIITDVKEVAAVIWKKAWLSVN